MTRPSSLRGAPGLFLATLLGTSLAPALAGCGAAAQEALLSCTVPADCGPAALCVQGACQASNPPVGDFTAPTGTTTNREVAVTGTAHDPDAGDAVASWAWTITPVSAACQADADVADAATLKAVFWCAGTYQLTLVVKDTTGLESAPVQRVVTVSALANAPTVTAGPPAAVEHHCGGAPLRCELAQSVGLTADGQAALGGAVTYRWSAIPPDERRADAISLLSPSATARNPSLAISTGGGPISGAWRLRVRIADGSGNLAQATQLVTVGNRPPVLDETALSLEHTFSGGAYHAGGALGVPVGDPDGDPLQLSVELAEPAGSGCTSSFTGVTGTGGSFALSCPTPAGLQAARVLHATATDVNGAAASALVPIEILNHLPVVLPRAGAGVTVLPLDHTVGPCPTGGGTCFLVADASPFVASDPDGDPLTGLTLVATVDPACATSTALTGAAGFSYATPISRPTEFRAADGTSCLALSATAADPFGASAPAAPLPVRILNRAPVVKVAVPSLSVSHRYDPVAGQYQASAQLTTFEDPDGDPMMDGGSVGDDSCGISSLAGGVVSVECRRDFKVAGAAYPTLAGFAGPRLIDAIVSDGWETRAVQSALTIVSRPPTVPAFTGAIEACRCGCIRWDAETPNVCILAKWEADAHHAVFPVHPEDQDGDPLAVTFSSSAPVSPASATSLPQACSATLDNATYPASVAVTVNDGVSQATATWTATQLVCAKAGQSCDTAIAVLRR